MSCNSCFENLFISYEILFLFIFYFFVEPHRRSTFIPTFAWHPAGVWISVDVDRWGGAGPSQKKRIKPQSINIWKKSWNDLNEWQNRLILSGKPLKLLNTFPSKCMVTKSKFAEFSQNYFTMKGNCESSLSLLFSPEKQAILWMSCLFGASMKSCLLICDSNSRFLGPVWATQPITVNCPSLAEASWEITASHHCKCWS